MEQKLFEDHRFDDDCNPAGGTTTGPGISISWQDGPLGRGPERKQPTGAFVEGVVQAAIGRLKFYQESKFRCLHNELAIAMLQQALLCLNLRTEDRERRGVEGAHEA